MATSTSMETEHPIMSYGYGAHDNSGVFAPITFSRRATRDNDVRFKVLYCGICHTDIHYAKNEWGITSYPVVPGHEIVGEVTEVGSKVKNFNVGDKVGVGCLVGSCQSCQPCSDDLEQFCPTLIYTYAVPDFDGTITYGGYSDHMVVNEHFVLHWPDNLPLDSGAPLLCAGISTYSPLKHYGLDKPGTKLGVVGLGGLGHIAVKMAKAFGVEVTVFSTTESKRLEALEVLKADHFVVSKDPEQMEAVTGTLNGILDTVAANHAILPFLNCLTNDGKLVLLGIPEKAHELSSIPLIVGRKVVGGSTIGGIKETQEMLDFSAKHGITADIELIEMDYLNTALDRLVKADVRYRFVIDVANSLKTP